MNVKQMVKTMLKLGRYDGLCNVDTECGCLLEDLAPCDGMTEDCESAFRVWAGEDAYDMMPCKTGGGE
jgi:hypothetical protein